MFYCELSSDTDMNDRRSVCTRRGLLAIAGVTALAGCLGDNSGRSDDGTDRPADGADDDLAVDDFDHPEPADDPGWEAPSTSPLEADIETEVLIENLEIPWDMTFTANGELFLTERTGSVLRFDSGEVAEVTSPVDAIDAGSVEPGTDEEPWWVEGGEGGTLGIASHPEYPDESYIYVYYTANDGDEPENQVVRYDVEASDPGETEETIIGGIPADNIHNGGRITFGPDDNLWACTGDAGEEALARDLDSLAGKVLRVSPEGEPLESNPDLDGDPRIFTYGHRNPQGICWLPSDIPVVTDHGPTARDELQVLRPGADYGWDEVRGAPGDDEWPSYADHEEFVPPVVHTGAGTTWAPTGATFYDGEDVPAWQNRLIVAGLISQSVYVVTLTPPGGDLPSLDSDEATRYDDEWLDDAYVATAHRVLADELGRVRHVAQSPDGELYAITSNRDGRADDESPFPRERDDVLVRITT